MGKIMLYKGNEPSDSGLFFFCGCIISSFALITLYGASGSSEGKAGYGENHCPQTTWYQQQPLPHSGLQGVGEPPGQKQPAADVAHAMTVDN